MRDIDLGSYIYLIMGLLCPMTLFWCGMRMDFDFIKATSITLIVYTVSVSFGSLMVNYMENGDCFKLLRKIR